MPRLIAGVGGLIGAAATIGGVAFIISGRGGEGAAVVAGGLLLMAVLMAWGFRAERTHGTDARQSSPGSARTRALLGAGAVLVAMVVGVALQRMTG